MTLSIRNPYMTLMRPSVTHALYQSFNSLGKVKSHCSLNCNLKIKSIKIKDEKFSK